MGVGAIGRASRAWVRLCGVSQVAGAKSGGGEFAFSN